MHNAIHKARDEKTWPIIEKKILGTKPRQHMKFIFFLIGFIWLITSISSLVISPFIGFKRKEIRNQIIEYWRATKNKKKAAAVIDRAVLAFCFFGFLFPATYPLAAGMLSLIFLYFA